MQPTDHGDGDPGTDSAPAVGRWRTPDFEAMFTPDLVVDTALLDIALRTLGWTRSRLADELDVDRTHMTLVLTRRARLTPEYRDRISRMFPQFRPAELFIKPDTDKRDAA